MIQKFVWECALWRLFFNFCYIQNEKNVWFCVKNNINGNGQIKGFARATKLPICFVIWFSWKFRDWMVLFGSLLDQFVNRFARANVLSKFELDADWFIDFSTRILINRFNGLETSFLSWIYRNQRSRFMLRVNCDICVNLEFRNSLLELGCFAGSMVDPTMLLFFRCFSEDQVG